MSLPTGRLLAVLCIFILSLFLLGLEERVASATPTAPTLTVNSGGDAPAASPYDDGVCATVKPDNGVCTLRAAIMEANHWPGGGVTIVFASPMQVGLTIPPAGADDETTGDLNISQTTHIIGLGAEATIIDAQALGDRVFHLAHGAVVDMSNLTFQNGIEGQYGGGGGLVDYGAALALESVAVISNTDNSGLGGGGILSSGLLTVTRGLFEYNRSFGGGGGGLASGGRASVQASVVYSNQANGGAGLLSYGSSFNLVQSTVASNTSSSYGGGFLAEGGQNTVQASLLADNFAGSDGGGLEGLLSAQVNVVNSTLTGNNAVLYGGGLEANSSAVVSLYNATVTNNRADYNLTGAGKGGGLSVGSGTVNLQNSLIAGNQSSTPFFSGYILAPDDCTQAIHSNGYNLIQNPNCTISGATTNLTGTDPLLGPLQGNGGPTWTQALLSGSPAIDAGNPSGCTGPAAVPLTTDQRGLPRMANGAGAYRCDIGAFELQRTVYLPLIQR